MMAAKCAQHWHALIVVLVVGVVGGVGGWWLVVGCWWLVLLLVIYTFGNWCWACVRVFC